MSDRIITSYDFPPIPFRDCDWSAYRDNYDADFDYEGGCYVSSCPVGRGPTELDAIFDLLEQEAQR